MVTFPIRFVSVCEQVFCIEFPLYIKTAISNEVFDHEHIFLNRLCCTQIIILGYRLKILTTQVNHFALNSSEQQRKKNLPAVPRTEVLQRQLTSVCKLAYHHHAEGT